MELKGTKTEKNLWTAFAGESQARNKYTYFASVAKKEGYEQIAEIFTKTAENEKEHAKMWFKALGELGVPVRLSNDANCAALGEVIAGAAKGAKSAIMITLGTGVGGGVILNGKIYEGDIGPGTEMGHTTLILGGEPCTCGQRGCLEAYASATGLLRQRHRAELAHPETAMKRFNPADGSAPFICAAEGDETAKTVVEQYITYVGAGIVNFVNIFAPEVVLIGGGVSNAGEALIGPLNDYVRANRYGGHRAPTCPIRRAALGGDAGIIGAAYLDFEV